MSYLTMIGAAAEAEIDKSVITGWTEIDASTDVDNYAQVHAMADSGQILQMDFAGGDRFRVLDWNEGTTDFSVAASIARVNGNLDGGFAFRNDTFVWISSGADDLFIYDVNGATITNTDTELNLKDFSNYPSGQWLEEDDYAIVYTGNQVGDSQIQTAFYNRAQNRIDFIGTPYNTTINYQVPIVIDRDTLCVLNTGNNNIFALSGGGNDVWTEVAGSTRSIASTVGRIQGCRMAQNRIAIYEGLNIQVYDWDPVGETFTPNGPAANIGASSWPLSIARIDDDTLCCHYFGDSGNRKVIRASY